MHCALVCSKFCLPVRMYFSCSHVDAAKDATGSLVMNHHRYDFHPPADPFHPHQAGWPCWAKAHYRAAQALQGLGRHVAAVRAAGAAARLEPGGCAGDVRQGNTENISPFKGYVMQCVRVTSSSDQELTAPCRLAIHRLAQLPLFAFVRKEPSLNLLVRQHLGSHLPALFHPARNPTSSKTQPPRLPSGSPEVQRLLREAAAALTRPQLAAQLLAAALAAPPPPRHPLPQLRRVPRAGGDRDCGDSINSGGPVMIGKAARAAAAGAHEGEEGMVWCGGQTAAGGGVGCVLATGVMAELREAAFQVVRDAEEGGPAVLWPGGEAGRGVGWGKEAYERSVGALCTGELHLAAPEPVLAATLLRGSTAHCLAAGSRLAMLSLRVYRTTHASLSSCIVHTDNNISGLCSLAKP